MKVAASRVEAKFPLVAIEIEVENREWLNGLTTRRLQHHYYSRGNDFSSTTFAMDFDWQRIFLCIALMRSCPLRVAYAKTKMTT